MSEAWHLLVPLFSAGVYAVAALLFKQAYGRGAGMMEAFYWMNFAGILAFGPLFLTVSGEMDWAQAWKPGVVGGMIFLGTWTTFAAIRAGDVSLVTPLMGTKVVLTALLAVALAGTPLGAGLGAAAVLTTVGILVLGWRDLRGGWGKGAAVGWCLVSSLAFAATDVLVGHWAAGFGRGRFLGCAFCGIGLFSVAAAPWQAPGVLRVPRAARPYLGWATGLMTGQTLAMALCNAHFNDPTRVNIVYGTRGLWSIGLVWFVGRRWFGNEERVAGGGAMGQRLAGSLLILSAVVTALLGKR